MRAKDLATDYPTVDLTTPAIEAARLLAATDLPGLIVLDHKGMPSAVLPSTQVLRLAVPVYYQDDPPLAAMIDEAAADIFIRELGDRTVQESLPPQRPDPPIVAPDATVLEVAALMARSRSPLVVVVGDGVVYGAITLHRLLDQVLA